MIDVCFENHAEHISIMCGQSVQILNVQPDDIP